MPSPIAHVAAGVFIRRMIHKATSADGGRRSKFRESTPLLMVLLVSLLPDVDSAVGLLAGDFGKYHNNLSHSFAAGSLAALVMAGLTARPFRLSFGIWFFTLFWAYQMHILMDFFTIGRGVMMFWPLSSERYSAPFKLFYGLHWSDGWFTIRHLWTVLTEVTFIAVVMRMRFWFSTIQTFITAMEPLSED